MEVVADLHVPVARDPHTVEMAVRPQNGFGRKSALMVHVDFSMRFYVPQCISGPYRSKQPFDDSFQHSSIIPLLSFRPFDPFKIDHAAPFQIKPFRVKGHHARARCKCQFREVISPVCDKEVYPNEWETTAQLP